MSSISISETNSEVFFVYWLDEKDAPALTRAWAKRHNAKQHQISRTPMNEEDYQMITGEFWGDFDDQMDYEEERLKRMKKANEVTSFCIKKAKDDKDDNDPVNPGVYEWWLISNYTIFASVGATQNYLKFRSLLIKAGYENEVDSVPLTLSAE